MAENEEKEENLEEGLDENLMQSDLFRDTIFETDPFTTVKKPKEIDQSAVQDYISKIETPTSTDPLSKQAAYYRQKGEADVLRMQTDVESFFMPAINLYNERVAAADAKYQLLKQQMPEFDDSKIFGEQGPNKTAMPVVDEIKNISTSIKADLRELSRLNINDPRYDELRKKVEKDQDLILEFDKINQKLLAIRNDIGTNEDGSEIKLGNNNEKDWSASIPENERRMWMDIYNSNGENIRIVDGKLMWIDPEAALGDNAIVDMMSSTELGKTTNVIQDLSEHFEGDGSGRYENLSELHLAGEGEIKDEQVERGFVWQAGGKHEGGTVWSSADGYDPNNIITQAEYDALSPSEQGEYKMWRRVSKEEDSKSAVIKSKQRFLINLGYLDKKNADGSDAADGIFGPNSQDAERRYLEDRDKLVKESTESYLKTDEYASKSVDTYNDIDLSTIGDGPRMKDGVAFRGHLNIIDKVVTARAAGADPNGDVNQRNLFNMTMVAVEDSFDALDIDGQASLLFDGINRVGKDEEALDVNTFLNDILSEKFGKDIWNGMTDEQRMNEMLNLKKGDGMLGMYTLNGKQSTLSQHFKDFYLQEMRDIGSAYKPPKTPKDKDSKDKSKLNLTNSSSIYSLNDENKYTTSYGNKTPKHNLKLKTGEIGLSSKDLTTLSGYKKAMDTDYKIKDGVLYFYDSKKKKWFESQINADADTNVEREMYNALIKNINTAYKNVDIKPGVEYTTKTNAQIYKEKNPNTKTLFDNFESIRKPTDRYSTAARHNVKEYLLDSDDEDFVVKELNERYGDLGFTFAVHDEDWFGRTDKIKVHLTNNPGVWYTFMTDRAYEKGGKDFIGQKWIGRKEDETRLINWLIKEYGKMDWQDKQKISKIDGSNLDYS